jgi:hypothetical protein
VAVLLALIVGYVRHVAVDSGQFANRATAALRDDSVKSLIARRVTDDVVLEKQGDLLAARPIIESAVSGIVGSRAFTNLFRAGVRDLHRALFDRDQQTVTLTIADIGTVVAAAVQKLRPALAKKVEANANVTLIKRNVTELGASLARFADRVRVLAIVLIVAALLLIAAALVATLDRRRTVMELGVGLALGGVLLVVAYSAVRQIAVHHVDGPDQQAAASAVWSAFLADLRTSSWFLAGAGAIVAAAAASILRPVDIGEPLRRVASWAAAEPEGTARRALRALALIALGVLVLIARDAVIALIFTAVGIYLVYEGVSAILRLTYRPGERQAPATRLPARPQRRRVAAVVVLAALVAAVGFVFVGSGGVTTAAPAAGPCNGQNALCSRSLDQVALAATHNAMSVPLPGWFSAEQDRPIRDQLDAGVRGLLIDSHYANRVPNGKVRTFFGSNSKLHQVAAQDGVSPAAVDAAMRIRDRLGFKGEGERGMYLCHTFCELGATPLGSALDDIHDFLVANPGEVLVVINQDYVTPADFVGAVNDADLARFAYRGPVSGKWPTLREMIDKNQRVVFLAENDAGGAPWYHLAYDGITEETPYTFKRVALLNGTQNLEASCKPNRGTANAPLFLMNHWISTDPIPKPSDAARVNAYDHLLARARKCQQLRGHIPNLLAVNFYARGDVFRVVDALNGVR